MKDTNRTRTRTPQSQAEIDRAFRLLASRLLCRSVRASETNPREIRWADDAEFMLMSIREEERADGGTARVRYAFKHVVSRNYVFLDVWETSFGPSLTLVVPEGPEAFMHGVFPAPPERMHDDPRQEVSA